MDKKHMMKRCLSLLIALVLIVAAGVLSRENLGYSVGRGDGTNARIARVEELSSLLNDLFSSETIGTIAATAATDGAEETYTSVTCSEVSSLFMDTHTHIDEPESMSVSFKESMRREMTLYITETDVFYDSKGTLSSRVDVNSESGPIDVSFHIRLYSGVFGTMLRFDEFTVAQNGVASDPFDKILGKWISFSSSSGITGSYLEFMNSLNEMNFRLLSLMGDYLKRAMNQNKGFTHNGGLYRMADGVYEEFANELVALAGGTGSLNFTLDGGFEADLSDQENPRVLLLLSGEQSTSHIYETDEFIFSNINNTKIELSKDLETISYSEFEAILGGK